MYSIIQLLICDNVLTFLKITSLSGMFFFYQINRTLPHLNHMEFSITISPRNEL